MREPQLNLSRIGPFALEEPLGNPATTRIFRGVHVERRLSVAVQLLPRALGEGRGATEFAATAERLKALVHPHVVRCYGGGIDTGLPYLALELIRGEPLAERLRRRGRLPWEAVVEATRGISLGLHGAHQKRFLHQRLTSDQVLLDEHGRVKLTGFALEWSQRHEGLTPRELSVTDASYLAPEQLDGQGAVGPWTDLYAAGCVMYEALARCRPFAANSLEELLTIKTRGPVPRVSAKELDCPVWLDALVSQLLSPSPGSRLANAAEVVAALDEAQRNVASGMGTAERTLSRKRSTLVVAGDRQQLERIRRKPRSSRDDSPFYERVWFLVTALAVLLAALTWALWPPSEETLFRKADQLMASVDKADWYRARDRYLEPLLRRFPDGVFAAEAQKHLDRIEMDTAQNKLQLNVQLGRPPACEGEALFRAAWEYEHFGDRATAQERYQALVNLLASSANADDRPYVNLARQRLAAITRDQGPGRDREQFVREHLARADELTEVGRHEQAQRIWESVISLYHSNRELQPLVARARGRLAGEPAPDKGAE